MADSARGSTTNFTNACVVFWTFDLTGFLAYMFWRWPHPHWTDHIIERIRITARTTRQTTTREAPVIEPAAQPIPMHRRTRAIRAPEGETKEARFDRLANHRVKAAIRDLRLIGQLAAPQYKWGDEQIAHIHLTLQSALDDVVAKFRREARGQKPEQMFSLVPIHAQPRAA